jgi:hypothetical protein
MNSHGFFIAEVHIYQQSIYSLGPDWNQGNIHAPEAVTKFLGNV